MRSGDTFRIPTKRSVLHACARLDGELVAACGRRFFRWNVMATPFGKPCASCAAALERGAK